MFDWNDLRYFLELARRGKLAAAALRLGVDHTTVARRIAALEDQLDLKLFDRENRSYKMNENGRRLLVHAEKMEAGSVALLDEIAPAATAGPSGTVRLATPEAFGSQFLARHCTSFRSHNPGITLELVAETRSLNFSRRDADAAITLSPPGHGRVVSEKLGDYRLRLYAAPSYLQKHPPVVRLPDLSHHHFIWYVEDLLPVPELQMLDKAIGNPQVIFRTTSVTGQAHAAEAGLGIALLPCYLADRMKGLTTVLPNELSILRDLWLVVHAELHSEPHIDRVASFLKTLVTSERRALLGAN
ncbi:LysR family transcriptional regulator [Kordiimonas sp.]|uniref:LysR family transcriptional regulator n=1 Tax=Kordiimonas sp. TaxID=1970157 RepID=UPI003A8CF0B7